MNRIMADLQTDHNNFIKLLKILSNLLNDFEQGKDPDFYLMLDIIDYIARYTDLIHHPKEEAMFDVYLDKAHEAPEAIHKLQRDHEELPKLRQEIYQLLEGFINDVGFHSRKNFCRKMQNFMLRQIEHLNTEENRLFPQIVETLSEDDWELIAEKIPEANDPLFGNHVRENYKNLLQYIVNQ